MKTFVGVAQILVLGFVLSQTTASHGKEVTLYRDEFGIPHVFAPSLESAAYAVGYAQAEDRLEELLKNYSRANGTMAEVFGPAFYRQDVIQRMWRHSEISHDKYKQVSPKMRAVIEAYQEGIKHFMKEHPEQVPAWAQEIHPWDAVALGRYIIWGWPMGEAGADLEKAGIRADEIAYRGSNEILLGPGRTAMKVPIAIQYEELTVSRAYEADFIVRGDIVVEVKATSSLGPLDARQLQTYLRFSGCPLGLLLNFGSLTLVEGIKRIVNNFPEGGTTRKHHLSKRNRRLWIR